jgi:tRNA (guanine26-N2/guanine27-N2)-dimethyltransferase
MKYITEGNTKLKIPEDATISKKDKIFYNPIMEVNRDISVSIVQSFLNKYDRDEFFICDPLGGSGARGLRYANELEMNSGAPHITIGDINPNAIKLAQANVELNKLNNVNIVHKDANVLLSENFRKFNVVDIDPFGAPAPYLDSAIRSIITKNGILCMTATDTAVLYGSYRKTCIRNYDATPLKGNKELAIRLLVGYAIRMASKYDIGLKPIFSHFTAHYVRTFLITERGAKKADEAVDKLGYVKNVEEEYIIKSRKEGNSDGFCGLYYLDNLTDENITKDAIKIAEERNYSKESIKVMKTVFEESLINIVGCFDVHKICKNIKKKVPPIDILMNELTEIGFKVCRTHHNPHSIKSDAKLIDIVEFIYKYNENIVNRQ